MNFPNYNAFRVHIQHLIEGDDTSQGTFSTSTLDIIIGLAEQRIYRDLRSSVMVKAYSQTIASNAAALPADMLELKEVYFAGYRPLDVIPLDTMRTHEAIGGGGNPRTCAQDGETIRFWPAATGTVLGSYYARPADLATGTWANQLAFARYPEVFIFGSMLESLPFTGMEGKYQLWEGKYQQALANARQDERVRVYGGGPLKVRTR
jgi:hypothetical protein